MSRFASRLLPAFLILLGFAAFPALASNVTVSGTVNFSALDGGPDDADHTVNGVFTVNGDLTVNGTINCNDGGGNTGACPMRFAVSGNVVLAAGSTVFAENRSTSGNGGDITFTVGGSFLMQGPTTTLAGAIVSSSKTNAGTSFHAGNITVIAATVTQEGGSSISAAADDSQAGAISITSSGASTIGGRILAGPTRTISTSTIYTGVIMSGGGGHVVGGPISITAQTPVEPALTVTSSAIIAAQGGDVGTSGGNTVSLEGCGIRIDGLVASLARRGPGPRVAIRSGTDITVDGSSLGTTSTTHLGRLRADATTESADGYHVDLFAMRTITVTGPSASSSLFAVTSNPGSTPSRFAGTINVTSTSGTVSATGNAFQVSGTQGGDQGGAVNVGAKNDVTLNGASIDASGATSGSSRAGGSISVRSYSGAINWVGGVGDVRPVGSSAGVPASQQGTILLTYCTTVSTSGTSFPTNGSPVGAFPATATACSPAAPSLPVGEPALPICCNVITVTNPSTTTATVGTPFSVTFTQTGAIGVATFTINSGTLPAGLTLSTSGVLSGTPTQLGSFPITVKVTDSQGCTGIGPTYNLQVVCPTITVTNPAVNTGVAGAPFSQTFTQSGGIGTTTFSETGALPTGITLSSSGVLSGTPTQTGTFPIVVTATDSYGCTGSSSYTLTITCQTITVTNPAVNSGTAGSPFSVTFTQSGGIGTTTFSESGALPAGLTFSSGGVLSGTPTQVGTFAITVTATDSNGCSGTGPTYSFTISCQVITVSHPAVMTGTVGQPFSGQYTQSGGIGTTTFSLTSGTLPAGMTLAADGTLSGTPTQVGTFPLTVTATDSNGCTGSNSFTLTITCQTITVTNPANTTGTVGTPFSESFSQSGAIGTATFTTASTLPTGLTLATDGTLSGTPTQPGTFNIVVTVTDSNGCTGTGPTYTLVISCQTITVTNPANTTGTVGTPFSETFTQSGGIGTVTFSTASTLPTGLTLSSSGVLSGTPTQPGTFPIVVTVTDSNGCTGTGATYTLVINCQTITVTNPSTNSGTVDAPFNQTFTESGAVGTATFSINSGSLPAGLTLSTTGILSGTPQVPGTFTITVKVTDANGCTGVGATYTLTIACQTITVTNPGANSAIYNTPFSATFTQSGVGTHGPAVFSLASGTLPTGLTLSSGGVLSGTPLQTGVFSITVKVTDANGCSGTGSTYTLSVAPKLTAKSYTAVGNTQLDGGGPAPATPTVVSVAVSSGDGSDAPITYALTVSPSHGAIAFNADGTFLYTPNVTNTTPDSFSYSGTSNGVTANQTAVINFTGRVWYVQAGGGAGDGRSHNPFNTLASAGSPTSAGGDFIYVEKEVSGTTPGSLTLQTGQVLIGAGATLNVPAVSPVLSVAGAAANTPTLVGSLTLAANVRIDGIDMSTGSATAVSGSGVSGINVNVRNLTTTTATAVSITGVGNGTALSPDSFTIASLNVGAGGGPATGLTVNNYRGTFTVNGGTVQNTSARGVEFVNVQNGTSTSVSLNGVTFTNATSVDGADATVASSTCGTLGGGGDNTGCNAPVFLDGVSHGSLTSVTVSGSTQIGINVHGGDTLSMSGVTVSGCGTNLGEYGVKIHNLTGTSTWSNLNIHDNGSSGQVWLESSNAGGALNVTVNNSSFTNGGNLFFYQAFGTSSDITLSFTGCTFTGSTTTGLAFHPQQTSGTASITVTGGTFTSNNNHIDVAKLNGVTVNYLIHNITNAMTGASFGSAINLFVGNPSSGTMSGTIDGTTIGTSGVPNSGCSGCTGIAVTNQNNGTLTANITNNFINGAGGSAINVIGAQAAAGTATTNLNITGNQITTPTLPSSLAAISIVSSSSSVGGRGSVCAKIGGSTASEMNTISGDWANSSGQNPIFIRLRFVGDVFRVAGYTGSGTDISLATGVAGYVAGNNVFINTTGETAGATLAAGASFTGGSPNSCP